MKKFYNLTYLLLVCILLTIQLQVNAQTVFITTGTAGTPAYNQGPIYRSSASSAYDASRYVYLYTSAEMSAAGINAGDNISLLGWAKNNSTTTVAGGIFRIYLKNSSASSFSNATETWANLNASSSLVYENLNQDIPATVTPTYIDFTLSSPFTYTGGSLEISVEWDINQVVGNPSTGTFDWLWSTVSSRIYGTANTTLAGTATLSSTTNSINDITNRRPFLKITYAPGGPCVSPPTPGDATASPATAVCATSPVTLNVTGHSSGTGQTYIWQTSPTLAGTYTDITVSSSTQSTLINPTTDAYYRVAVTCGVSTTYSTPVFVNVVQAFPGGTYTINSAVATGGTNFQTFTAAVNALSCGIAGPVVFNVDAGSGPYTEQITIPVILGASSVNTVTFNGNGRTLQFTSVTGARHIIKLDGADYVTINNLNIKTLDATYGWGILLTNAADNNTISNNIINLTSVTSTTSSNSVGIVATNSATSASSSGNNANNNTITGNTITGGYEGIHFYGGSSTVLSNNVFTNNMIQDFYTYGIYMYYTSGTQITGNDIKRLANTTGTTFYGIYFSTGNTGALIDANRIHDTHNATTSQTTAAYGIFFTGSDATAGNENKVTNNLIYNFNSTSGIQYGIANTSSDYALYYHNTIALEENTSTGGTTYGFNQLTTATGIEFKNNIVKISRAGTGTKYLLYFGATTTASTIVSDYNDLIITSSAGLNYTGYLAVPTPAVSYVTLSDWQTGSAQDANSVVILPNFVSPVSGNFTPQASALNNLGTPVGVFTDFLGAPRDPATPDIGAYEFDVSGCTSPPTPGTLTSNASGTICPGTTVTLGLTGNSIGTGQTYQLESSLNSGGPFSTLGGSQSSSSFTINPTQSMYYRVAVTCSGNTQYSAETFVSVAVPFSGTYTINSAVATGGTNYQTFTDALSAMACGINGPVVFNVDAGSGPYTEQITIPVIPGASSVNTVTFNGNGRILQFTPTSSFRYVIKLDGADYVTINNLNIKTLDATYGWGIMLSNGADNNTISNNIIDLTAVTSITSGNSVGIVATNSNTSASSSGNNANNNLVTGNTITGGYEGIHFYGGSTTVLADNVFSNNTIQDFYTYGMYLYYTSRNVISGNNIRRPANITGTTFYGIYFSTGNTGALINANRIHDTHNATTSQSTAAYGVYFTGSDATAGSENRVTNNLLYNFNSTTGIQYALYNSSSDYALYYHNTILLNESTSTSGTTYGFYQTTLASGIEFENNIVKIERGGTGSKYLLYYSTSTTIVLSEYNDLVMASTGGTTNVTGYQAGATTTTSITLADWQANSGHDLNSVSIEPEFVNAVTGDFTPLSPALDNKGTPVGVLTDFTGASRSGSTPDIGAIEFAIPLCTSPPTAGTTTTDAVGIICPNTLVTINLVGNSTGLNQTYQLQVSSTPGGPYTSVGSTQTSSVFTDNPTSTVYYRVAVTCSGNTQYSAEVMVTIAQLYPAGTYTINSAIITGGGNFQSFTAAVNAIACGIDGPVVFNVDAASGPYIEQVSIPAVYNTSSVNTITFNGNGRTIQFAPVTNARYIIELNGTDYVTINNLNIKSIDATYGYGIHLTNQANNNTISNNTIDLSAVTSTTSTNSAGITASATATSPTATGNNANFTNITGNTVIGGYYGIIIAGASATKSMNNNVLNNTVRDFYSEGIELDYNDGSTVAYNDISRGTRVAVGTFYGLDLGTANQSVTLNANRVHDTHTSATTQSGTAYGVYTSGSDAPAGFENKVTNNLLYNFNSITGTQYGIYNSSSDSIWYYHNTIALTEGTSTAGTTRGFYQTGLATGIRFMDNIVYITRGGTGTKHLLYFGTATSNIVSDYNDLVINSPAGLNYTGYLAGAVPTDYATLAEWQSASGQDLNSLAIEPMFENTTLGIYKPTALGLDNLGLPVAVLTDIVNMPRSSSTPDIGAYEFNGVVVPVKLVNLFATKYKNDILVNWATSTEINSKHYEIERSYDGMQFTYAGTVISKNSANGSSYGFNDLNAAVNVSSTVVYYRLKMVDMDGRFEYSLIVSVKLDKDLVTNVQAYPNPFKDNVAMKISATKTGHALITISDLNGKTLYHQNRTVFAGVNVVSLQNTSVLASGIYHARIIIDGEQFVIRLIKN